MLRAIEESDLEWIKNERNRPECMKWFRQPDLLSMKDQLKWFYTTDMKSYIVLDDVGDKIGVVSLSHIDNVARKCEFSMMIIPEMRHRGLGHMALWQLLKIAFNDLNMNQVYSDVFEGNCALECYKKWGFKEYGIFPNWYYKDGKYINSHIISITKDEYNNSLKPTLSE